MDFFWLRSLKNVRFQQNISKFFFHSQYQKQPIYVHFYLLYQFPNFEKKMLCTLDTNMQKLYQKVRMNLLLLSSITCPQNALLIKFCLLIEEICLQIFILFNRNVGTPFLTTQKTNSNFSEAISMRTEYMSHYMWTFRDV